MSSWLLCILYVLVSSKVNISPSDQQTLSNTGPLRSVCVCLYQTGEKKLGEAGKAAMETLDGK